MKRITIAVAALCLALGLGPGPTSANPVAERTVVDALAAPQARDAIARVAIAEAANQGDSGLAAVIQTILNRLAAGQWGETIDSVVDAVHQFEPVMRAGGDWRRLPAVSAVQRAHVDTIINLMLDGRLPDFIGGALYFQNPRIVAARAAAGAVSPSLVNFGGRTPSAVIGAHAFYRADGSPQRRQSGSQEPADSAAPIFAGSRKPLPPTRSGVMPQPATDPSRSIFILSDGRLAADHRTASTN